MGIRIRPDRTVENTETGAITSLHQPASDDDNEETASRPVATSPHRPAPLAKKSAPPNVIQLAKARKKYLDSEIRRLRKLERERDELVRLLDAAKNKPRTPVVIRGQIARPAN